MATREEITAEIQNVPDERLAELYRIIKGLEAEGNGRDESDVIAMAALRRIKIPSPTFS
jgi:hypothetical protein